MFPGIGEKAMELIGIFQLQFTANTAAAAAANIPHQSSSDYINYN